MLVMTIFTVCLAGTLGFIGDRDIGKPNSVGTDVSIFYGCTWTTTAGIVALAPEHLIECLNRPKMRMKTVEAKMIYR